MKVLLVVVVLILVFVFLQKKNENLRTKKTRDVGESCVYTYAKIKNICKEGLKCNKKTNRCVKK